MPRSSKSRRTATIFVGESTASNAVRPICGGPDVTEGVPARFPQVERALARRTGLYCPEIVPKVIVPGAPGSGCGNSLPISDDLP